MNENCFKFDDTFSEFEPVEIADGYDHVEAIEYLLYCIGKN